MRGWRGRIEVRTKNDLSPAIVVFFWYMCGWDFRASVCLGDVCFCSGALPHRSLVIGSHATNCRLCTHWGSSCPITHPASRSISSTTGNIWKIKFFLRSLVEVLVHTEILVLRVNVLRSLMEVLVHTKYPESFFVRSWKVLFPEKLERNVVVFEGAASAIVVVFEGVASSNVFSSLSELCSSE